MPPPKPKKLPRRPRPPKKRIVEEKQQQQPSSATPGPSKAFLPVSQKGKDALSELDSGQNKSAVKPAATRKSKPNDEQASSSDSDDLLIPGLEGGSRAVDVGTRDSDSSDNDDSSSSSSSSSEGSDDLQLNVAHNEEADDESSSSEDSDEASSSSSESDDMEVDMLKTPVPTSSGPPKAKKPKLSLSRNEASETAAISAPSDASASASAKQKDPTPDQVLASLIFAYSSDSAPDSDPESALTRDERTWASLAPWEEEFYGPLRTSRLELRATFESTSKTLEKIKGTLAEVQKDMEVSSASMKMKNRNSRVVSERETLEEDPRLDPLNPAFDVSFLAKLDSNHSPPRHDQNQKQIRTCLLEIRDSLKPLVKSWDETDPRLDFYAQYHWQEGVPEKEELDRSLGKTEKTVELLEYPPYSVKPEYVDLFWSAKDPIWKDRYEAPAKDASVSESLVKGSSNAKETRQKASKPSAADDEDMDKEPGPDPTTPLVLKFGDITVVSLQHMTHPAYLPPPETPAHLKPYTQANTPSLPYLGVLLYGFFSTCVSRHKDPTPFFLDSVEETASQEPLFFSTLNRKTFLETGPELADTLAISKMIDAVRQTIAVYIAALDDRDMYDALEIRRARRAARAGKKRGATGEPKKMEEWQDPLLDPFDPKTASKERKDAFAQSFLDTYRPEMEQIRAAELERLKSKDKKDAETVRKEKAAAARMKNLAGAIRMLGFRDETDLLIEEEVKTGKRLF